MTAAPDYREPVVTHPMDAEAERPYVSSTAVDTAAWIFGGRYADRPAIRQSAEALIDQCEVTIATYADEPSILGYVARSPGDGSVELLYLRLSLADVKTVQWKIRAQRDPKLGIVERSLLEHQIAAEMSKAVDVAQALLPEVAVTFRRLPPFLAMEACVRGGHQPRVVPRGI